MVEEQREDTQKMPLCCTLLPVRQLLPLVVISEHQSYVITSKEPFSGLGVASSPATNLKSLTEDQGRHY